MNKALFLDRDGTINYDPGYLGNPDSVKLYPGVGEGIALLKKKFDYKIIVISNQAGIARGLITKEQVNAVNERVNELLSEFGAGVDEFYFCPHHPDFSAPEDTECRKPSPKMIIDAAEKHNIDLNTSFMIGDKISDIESGINAGVKTIFICNEGNNGEERLLKSGEKKADYIAENFTEAARFIINEIQEITD